MSKILGLDLDGVVADWEGGFRKYVAAKRGVDPLTLAPATSWSFVDNGWFKSESEFQVEYAAALRSGLLRKLGAYPGASRSLWALSDAGVHIRIITHRLIAGGTFGATASDTVTFLEANRIPFRDLCFVADKSQVYADVYLDDAAHNIVNLRGHGGYAIVFDQLYNRSVDGPRVHNWAEAKDAIAQRLDLDLSQAAA